MDIDYCSRKARFARACDASLKYCRFQTHYNQLTLPPVVSRNKFIVIVDEKSIDKHYSSEWTRDTISFQLCNCFYRKTIDTRMGESTLENTVSLPPTRVVR